MIVLRRASDFLVELEVGRHRVAAVLQRVGEGVERLAHGQQIGIGAALRGQRGGFGLEADAQLQHGHHVLQGAVLFAADLEPGVVAEPEHERADAMARLDEPGGLQLGEGFAHHGAADLELRHDGRFGGHLVAHLQTTVADAFAERGHEF